LRNDRNLTFLNDEKAAGQPRAYQHDGDGTATDANAARRRRFAIATTGRAIESTAATILVSTKQ